MNAVDVGRVALLLATVQASGGGLNGVECTLSSQTKKYEMYESTTDPGGVWNAGCMAGCLMTECAFDVHPTPPTPTRRRLAGGKSPEERGCGTCNAVDGGGATRDWCDAEERKNDYSTAADGAAKSTARETNCNALGGGGKCEYGIGWDYDCYKDDFQHSFAADRRDVTWDTDLLSCVCDKCGSYIQEGLQGLYCDNATKVCTEDADRAGYSEKGYSLQKAADYASAYLTEAHLCPNHDPAAALPSGVQSVAGADTTPADTTPADGSTASSAAWPELTVLALALVLRAV